MWNDAHYLGDERIRRRPFGRRPFGYRPFGYGYGAPFFGGFLGGLATGALLSPYGFGYGYPYPYYGFGYGGFPYYF